MQGPKEEIYGDRRASYNNRCSGSKSRLEQRGHHRNFNKLFFDQRKFKKERQGYKNDGTYLKFFHSFFLLRARSALGGYFFVEGGDCS